MCYKLTIESTSPVLPQTKISRWNPAPSNIVQHAVLCPPTNFCHNQTLSSHLSWWRKQCISEANVCGYFCSYTSCLLNYIVKFFMQIVAFWISCVHDNIWWYNICKLVSDFIVYKDSSLRMTCAKFLWCFQKVQLIIYTRYHYKRSSWFIDFVLNEDDKEVNQRLKELYPMTSFGKFTLKHQPLTVIKKPTFWWIIFCWQCCLGSY